MNDLLVETKVYNLSTRSTDCDILNANTDFKSKCSYYFPDLIVRDESIEFIQYSIQYAVIPVSYYIINENNNKLVVLQNNITTTYSFPLGNYTARLFMTQFVSTLGAGWTITLDDVKSQFTIKHASLSFTLLSSSTIDFVIGFTNSVVSTFTGGFHTAVMVRPCNFLPLPRIRITSDELTAGGLDNTVITIPNNSRLNGQIVYQNVSNTKLLFRENTLSRFILNFVDDDGNYINFNGISSFFTIEFNIFRKFTPKLPSFNKLVEMNVNREKYYFEDPSLIDDET